MLETSLFYMSGSLLAYYSDLTCHNSYFDLVSLSSSLLLPLGKHDPLSSFFFSYLMFVQRVSGSPTGFYNLLLLQPEYLYRCQVIRTLGDYVVSICIEK